MPRVRGLTQEQKIDYQSKLLADKCNGILTENHISKHELAEALNISVQAVYKQFRNRKLSLPMFMTVISLTNPDPESIQKMLNVEGL